MNHEPKYQRVEDASPDGQHMWIVTCRTCDWSYGPADADTITRVFKDHEAGGIKAVVQSKPQTQKARGVLWLKDHGYNVPGVKVWTQSAQPTIASWPQFARPCPITPRHGFVDSRVVNSLADAQAVFAEAIAADPQAEMMLMRPITAQYSAVLTPRMAAVGNGHDGATAGKEGVLNLPLTHVDLPAPSSLIPAGQVPYMELVYSTEGGAHPVQLRSGPALDGGNGNYVPADVTVTNVLNAHDLDPMALESALAYAPVGTVVWQADGSPCSHAACHARLNNVAILFDEDAPVLGVVLKATQSAAAETRVDAFRQALRNCTDCPDLRAAYVWSIHQAFDLCQTDVGASFVATACASIWQHAAAASVAEARHALRDVNGKRRRKMGKRSKFYGTLLGKSPIESTLRARTKLAAILFGHSDYWNSGFGGDRWEGCALSALRLYDALAAATTDHAGDDEIRECLAAAHAVVNAAHNNGPFLNKFVESGEFDKAARGDTNLTIEALRDVARFWDSFVETAVESSLVWPKRRHGRHARGKAAVLPTLAEVWALMQWNYRQNGSALHVQYGTSGSYISATIPLTTLAESQRAAMKSFVNHVGAATMKSYADTESRYWQAGGVLTAITITALFPNLKFGA